MKKGMLDTLANVAANLESFDGVYVITIQKGVDQNDDDIGFAASGDTLSKIARQFYNDGNQWQRIFDANRDILSNPDRISPGQHLRIP